MSSEEGWWLKHYGKTYAQWVEEKAERILAYLMRALGGVIDLQELLESVYVERLKGIASPDYPARKYLWKPVKGRLTDFKPSPFMKNFAEYLISELKSRGYLFSGYVVEIGEKVRAVDAPTAPARELPRVEIQRIDRLIRLPTKEELVDICTWKP